MHVPQEAGILCGGGRAGPGCVQAFPGDDPDGWVGMQGSAYGEAFAEDSKRLRAQWFSTVLVGDVPKVGRCVMRYRDDTDSTVSITSNTPEDAHFFPADAVQTLHYRMTVVDEDGQPLRELVADKPMIMTAQINAIPPLGTAFLVAETITFSDEATGDPVVVLRAGSEGRVLAGTTPLEVHSPLQVADDGRFALEVSPPPFGAFGEDRSAPVWWAVTTHGVHLDSPPPILSPAAQSPLSLSGVRVASGMVIVHAFQFGVDEEQLQEGHVALRI